MASGMAFWFSYQLFWTYYEVWLRTPVPDMCAADIVLFLHIVPFIAALALRPHAPQDEYAARLRRLDFALMMVWWIFLYVLIVIPWQYVVPDAGPYGNNLNLLYLIEKVAFLGTLVIVWFGSKEGWKTFYASLFGASLIYAGSSYLANWALSRHFYDSGSLYAHRFDDARTRTPCRHTLDVNVAWRVAGAAGHDRSFFAAAIRGLGVDGYSSPAAHSLVPRGGHSGSIAADGCDGFRKAAPAGSGIAPLAQLLAGIFCELEKVAGADHGSGKARIHWTTRRRRRP
jgi:hypothetical protein